MMKLTAALSHRHCQVCSSINLTQLLKMDGWMDGIGLYVLNFCTGKANQDSNEVKCTSGTG